MQHQTFLNEHGFDAYREYTALKRHFTTKSYDYHKYNGKINISFDNFISRRDAYSFQKLSKRRDYKNLILSNMIINPKLWIGDLLEETANANYLDWKRRTDSITAHIQDQLIKLKDDFKLNFISINGQYPHIVTLYLNKEVSLETFCVLTKITKSQTYWTTSVVDNVMFPGIMMKVDKYYPFLVYSSDKVKKVVKDHFF
jgi:hypothetical protein